MKCLICKQKIDKRAKKYCSKKCYFLVREKDSWYKKCEFCGNNMKVKRSDVEKYNRGKYCSKLCVNKAKKRHPKNINLIICLVCKKEFTTSLSKRIYCSLLCKNIGISKKILNQCENCGRVFSHQISKKRKFCSKKCYFETIFQRGHIEKTCLNCKRKFTTSPSYIKRKEGLFCSRKCSSIFNSTKNWNNKEWKEKQIKAMLKGLLKRPTSLERQMIEIIQKYNLPYKYTGNGSFWIAYKNPDFINTNGEKKLIEVANDFELHHPKDYAEKRKNHFSKYGWESFIFTGIKNKLNKEEILKILI